MKRALIATVVTVAAAIVPAQSASAHGGSEADLTSDYRTRVTDVPDVDGLDARAVGLDGTIEITWQGQGTLIVTGYEGESYLRFDAYGVARNLRSPATYLNQDRYAEVELPDSTDAKAAPEWEVIALEPTYRWHDHRTHWMSPDPPPQAQQDPDRSHVIDERWEIPLTVDDRDVTIAGDLTWAPAPPLLPWLGLALVIAVAAGAALWSRVWRPAAATLAGVGTIALTTDTIGFVAQLDDSIASTAWAFVYAIALAGASLRLVVHARRPTSEPTLAMMIAGLLLLFMGGFDRFDVLTSGFYQSAFDVTVARVTTVLCLGIGAGLIARFLRFLAPLLLAGPAAPTDVDKPANDLKVSAG
jgi:hypothetical protein